jgi:hypothetical protein
MRRQGKWKNEKMKWILIRRFNKINIEKATASLQNGLPILYIEN